MNGYNTYLYHKKIFDVYTVMYQLVFFVYTYNRGVNMKDNSILPMVGKRIRQIRKLKGFTQEELGEKCGFHFSYIGGVERAEKNISLINVQKLADALEVPVQEFFSYERSSSRKNSERENVMTEVNELLIEMKTSDLKKVKLFLSEIMSNK